jgi:hypothetical protein
MYTLPEPPYFLLVAGLVAGIASGLAFQATLKLAIQEWSKNRSTQTLVGLTNQLSLPFFGISAGVCVFLASGLEIFGFPSALTYVVALPLTLMTSWLIWSQLGVNLIQLERGGSKALDLDSFN